MFIIVMDYENEIKRKTIISIIIIEFADVLGT